MPDAELAHRYLRLSEESRAILQRLAALRRDTRALAETLGTRDAVDWGRRVDWVTDCLNGLDEQVTRHTALQGDLPGRQYEAWLQKAERLGTEWEACNAEARRLLAEVTSPADIEDGRGHGIPPGEVLDRPEREPG